MVIPRLPYPYIQTQNTSSCDESVGTHDLAYSVSDQITIHRVNTGVNNNDDSHSFERYRENNRSYSSLGDIITTKIIPNVSKLPQTGK